MTPLAWMLIAAVGLAAATPLVPRPLEGPLLALAALVLLAVVRGISAERFRVGERPLPPVSRHGVLSTQLPGEPAPRVLARPIPTEPLQEGLDEIEWDLRLLQERLHREAAGR